MSTSAGKGAVANFDEPTSERLHLCCHDWMLGAKNTEDALEFT